MEIREGMCGLPQAGRLVNDKLKILLKSKGYYPNPHTPDLWTYKSKDIYFSLVVYDFGVNILRNPMLRIL